MFIYTKPEGWMTVLAAQSIKGYELLDLIGEGSYGAVYRAQQPLVDRQVAIKIILPQFANEPEFIRRFETEAQLVAQLEHLHIVPLYDYWRDPEGAYLVMRLMKGGSLEGVLQKLGSMSPEDTAKLVDQIASALDAAHQQGVVHRDLKPANILLDEDGNAYLSDFGIAKELGVATDVTQTSAILGTPAYITPEQVQNQQISPQTDIYALGVLIYELLVGEHPFPNASTAELVVKHLQEPLPYVRDHLPNLTAAVDGVIQRATAKIPGDRYLTASALAGDFRRALELEVTYPEIPESEIYNPYKGLRAFQESDSDDFFGRGALIGQLLAQLAAPGEGSRFLAVVGPSGSGKSSVVKAGLLPALRKGALPGSDRWFISETHPGSHPLKELQLALLSITADPDVDLAEILKQGEVGLLNAAKAALPDDDSELLLVIDQFEELFILGEDADEREHYLESLHRAVTDPENHVRVVITLRADFYDRPLMHPDFGRLVEERTAVVLPFTSEELEQAIQWPAERVGAVLEKGLVSEIISEVAAQPGALPLLQYALTELFERREGRMLTNQAYQTIGGVLGALGRRAEEVYSELDLGAKDAARQLFLRLVTLGEGAEDTRRRVLRSELASIAFLPSQRVDGSEGNINTVIDIFGKARLLTFDHDPVTREPTVEVAHEALLGEWRRLRSWLDNSRVDIRMQRLLGEAALEWQGIDRDPGYLLRGSRLDQFEAWATTTDIALTQVEGEYLEASLAERRLREAEEEERQAREAAMERRSRNFLRGLVAVLAIATVVAVVLTVFAFNQRGEAQNSAAIAQSEADAHATQRVIAESEAELRATQQVIAEEEADARATAEAIAIEQRDEVLRQASVALSRQALELKDLGDPELAVLLTMAALEEYPYTPQTEKALAESVLEVPSSRLIPGDQNLSWLAVTWSPSGDQIATATYGVYLDASILIQDPETGAEILDIPLGVDCATASNVVWSPPGDRLIAIPQFCDYAPRVFDAQTGELLTTLVSEPEQANFSAAWSPDGNTILTGSLDGYARIWDAQSGERLREISAHDNYLTQVAWSPTGEQLATASNDDTAKIWDAATGELLQVYAAFTDDLAGLAWSPEGEKIAAVSLDGNALVWDAASGERLYSLEWKIHCH
jgi:serine/threonine protein kinase